MYRFQLLFSLYSFLCKGVLPEKGRKKTPHKTVRLRGGKLEIFGMDFACEYRNIQSDMEFRTSEKFDCCIVVYSCIHSKSSFRPG